MFHRISIASALLLLGACRAVEPVPEDLDGLVHYLWQRADTGEDADVAEAVDNLHAAIDGDNLEGIVEGLVSSLSVEEVADLGRDVDPSTATGVVIADWIDCTRPQLEAVLAYEQQDELYVGVYDLYEREMLGSGEDFLAERTDRLGWDLVYQTSLLGAGYTVNSQTLMRRVASVPTEHGPALVLRAHMTEPATFDNPDSNNYLDQDYHLEAYWPHDGGMLHVYALWKDTRMLGFEDEGESTQRIILNNLADWDEGTSQICQEGLP